MHFTFRDPAENGTAERNTLYRHRDVAMASEDVVECVMVIYREQRCVLRKLSKIKEAEGHYIQQPFFHDLSLTPSIVNITPAAAHLVHKELGNWLG
ncbi:unnamed protein product [Haemonchus placei]|uniref:Mediator complex subunit 18 n=1 Tax=Haemonchus placei TaxID=6290 RepID=A0A0N4X805_HAEPC|nr:unnamed protein product [Haemonchus placei]